VPGPRQDSFPMPQESGLAIQLSSQN
jgi:hypothetical protein